jgi:CubicO group peptidase (beta-lactamase class C family)
MNILTKTFAVLILAVCVFNESSAKELPVVASANDINLPKAPINELNSTGFMRNWLVVGDFPNPEIVLAGMESGFDKDYLTSAGNEPNAVLTTDANIPFEDESGKKQIAKSFVLTADKRGWVDIGKMFDNEIYRTAYAFSYLRSDKPQIVHFYFSYDDQAKIWVNGRLALERKKYATYAFVPREDRFSIELNEGLNSILIKACQAEMPWAFVLEAYIAENIATLETKEIRKKQLADFQNCKLRTKGRCDFMFEEGKFPEIVWEDPYLVENVLGKFDLKVRWFDAELNEVNVPQTPGRYAAYIEATTPEGIHIRRAMTFYCRSKDWCPWGYNLQGYMDYLPNGPIDKEAFTEHREIMAPFLGMQIMNLLQTKPEGAVLMSYLAEIKPVNGRKLTQLDGPSVRDQDYHLALKRKIMGVENKYPQLKLPHNKAGAPATVLHTGTTQEAGVKADAAQSIHKVCQEWYDASGLPFTVLIARHGVIVIHEAFGSTKDSPIDLKTHFPLASITKAHTGLMFAQFIDQGLIGLDDPVGKYLPDFPTEGDKVLTLRNCLTHTSGLEGHYEWGGMDNPWLDNIISNNPEAIEPGKNFIYNGMGFDLAGKVMEVVSGKSIFRLMQENLFMPLGQDDPTIMDLATGLNCTAADLARIGQLILNRGSYGQTEFYSDQTYENWLKPKPLKEFYPNIENLKEHPYNMGLIWLYDWDPGKKNKTILSEKTLGHAAASSTILRVDMENELVIAMCRFNGGNDFYKHFQDFLLVVGESLKDKK